MPPLEGLRCLVLDLARWLFAGVCRWLLFLYFDLSLDMLERFCCSDEEDECDELVDDEVVVAEPELPVERLGDRISAVVASKCVL